jgi:hypothetical protein
VLRKLEQQASETIRNKDFMDPIAPILYNDSDTKEKITNGIVKIIQSLIVRLRLQKNNLTWTGSKFPNNIVNKNANKKTTGIANFFISFYLFNIRTTARFKVTYFAMQCNCIVELPYKYSKMCKIY